MRLFQRFLRREEPEPTAGEWIERGNAALQSGDLATAASCYERARRADPASAQACVNGAYVALEQGDAGAALDLLRSALQHAGQGDASIADAHFLRGRAHRALADHEHAFDAFAAAVQARPGFLEPMAEAFDLAQQLGRHDRALAWAQRLQEVHPSTGHMLSIARALSGLGRPGEALALLDAIVALEPQHAEAWTGRGGVLADLGRLDEAVTALEHAVQASGRTPTARIHLAQALARAHRPDDALALLDELLAADPLHRDAAIERVLVLSNALRIDEAIAAGEHAVRVHPQDAYMQWALACVYLLAGDFEKGWPQHEWRWQAVNAAHVVDFGGRRWEPGCTIAGKTLLVYAEQGFGDTIQFVRFLPQLAARAGKVYLAVQGALDELVAGMELPPNCVHLPAGSAAPSFDLQIPLMSLPLALGTTLQDIPSRVPYLRADPARVVAWRQRLAGAEGKLKVGLVWSGNPDHHNDRNRSIPLRVLHALDDDRWHVVTLQPQVRASDEPALAAWTGLQHAGAELRSFADTAALMEALDVVVCVDTSVAHLAGALGRPVWILLPWVPDWRWLLETESSPWYPSARLFRQGPDREWGSVLAQVKTALAALSSEHAQRASR